MKTFAQKKKPSTPKVNNSPAKRRQTVGPIGYAQRAVLRNILRPNEGPARPDVGEPVGTHKDASHQRADFQLAPTTRTDSGNPGGSASLQRAVNDEPEEALQRQPDQEEEEPIQADRIQRQQANEEEEEPVQAKRIQRQQENPEEEEPVQSKRIQRQIADVNGIKASRFGFVGADTRAQQAKIRRILRATGAQTKLTVGQPDDDYEKEADRVAEQVMRMRPADSVQRQSNNDEEEDTLQKKPLADQITPLVQRQEEPPEEEDNQAQPLQRTETPDVENEEDLQRAKGSHSSGTGSTPLSGESERRINQLRGAGQPLPQYLQRDMENKFNTDFSGVGVHDSGESSDLNRQVGARAFTVGNDIFMGAGEYAPDSPTGQKLMAHELTHVVQQRGPSAQPKLYRQVTPGQGTGSGNGDPTSINTETGYDGPEGTASTTARTMTIREIHFPAIPEKQEKTGSRNVQIRKGSEERDTNQVQVWSRLTRDGTGLGDALDDKTNAAWHSGSESNPTYFMKIGRRSSSYLVGTRTAIRDRVIRPYWRPSGRMKTYDVDHKKEYQLGGHDESPAGNLWLLESRTNRSSGSRINNKINQEIDQLLGAWTSTSKPDRETARNDYTITLGQIHWDGPVEGDGDNYSVEDISESATQMDSIVPMNRRAVSRAGLDPGEGQFVVFNNRTGGRARQITLPASTGDTIPFTDENFVTGFRPTTARFVGNDDQYIEVIGTLWADNPAIYGHGFPTSFTISRMPNLPQAGYLNVSRAEAQIREIFGGDIEASALSPLTLTRVGMDELGAPVVEGTVNTDISFLEGADIGFFIRGNDLGIEKTFSSSELNTPSPFEIEEASLTVSLSTQRGLAAEGNVAFKIDRVGTGNVTANVGTGQEFGLSGNFTFDEQLFGEGTSAEVRMAYESGEWSVGGTLTIPEGKVPGVRSATINVDYSEGDGFSAEGEAELDVPGIESGTLSVAHSEEEGFSIGGSFNLSADTPGIRGGTISARISERTDGEGYSVSASGEAQPDIPGINSNLSVSYNDGAFTAEVTADYSRGMLSGQVNAGVTNRTLGEDGQLSDTAEPGNPLIVYGGGELTIQIAPWLQGTAGVQFAPNGEITVSGEIGLPGELEIFPRREINKSIFNIAVQAPIFPGIVAEIGGGLGATAGIGPGVIDQLALGITYNPAREEDTTITGDAHLRVPADAGLRLSVRAGIGLGITGASATGGLEIGGTLGIEGAAEAGVHVEWSPRQGLDLAATVSVHAQPAFTFDISGYVSVRALGFSVYDQTWEFASFRFGSDYRFGIRLPVHYREGEPFDVSLDDVEFEVPEIDTDQLLKGLIARIA